MTKKLSLTLIYLLITGSALTAQQISDVKKNDPAYSPIKKSVQNGYLSLFQGNEFAPRRSITRKEMAVIIDKLLAETEEQNLNLSPNEIQQLTTLSASFKGYIENNETQLNKLNGTFGQLEDDQKVLHHDITQLNEILRLEKETNKRSQIYMWIGIATAALLGTAI